ncbi:MAG TPA: endonuclease/exonuclease/phosphatase family protein [Archangium sp.]|uniref:endonuclease/exonuclease/phosphatase family protein n=1 Tax=Archangium sp. TaxID=1872627 RepID=UPI002E309B37|nr:endonuclease/exonuclease/phosphatase family protein [Archangium sp.]HEX5749571.1 endonuclease/exonuclease/phosphatase family protein [Archangium sp.]
MPGQALSRLLDRLPFGRNVIDGVPAAPPQHLPHREPTQVHQGFESLPAADGPRLLGNGTTLLVHHPRPRPPRDHVLRVMTYNILLGGERRALLEAYFASMEELGRMPDVIALQEASQPTAMELARDYGFHLVYQGRDVAGPVINGKAILSRHPILEAAHYTYAFPEDARAAAIARQGFVGELDEDRGALFALIDVPGTHVALYNVHHTLGDSGINAGQLWQLQATLHARDGIPSIALGDFNANINVKHHYSLLPGPIRKHEPTETVKDYESRYGNVHPSVGDWGVGNIGDVRVRRALHALEHELPDPLRRARELRVRLPDGSFIKPDEARAKLVAGCCAKNSEQWLRLQDVADMSTLNSLPNGQGVVPATGKRFDTFFASRQLEPLLLEVDHSTDASDHLPSVADFQLRGLRH